MNMMKKVLFAGVMIMLSAGLYAQSIDEVGAKYNEGNEAMKAKDYAKAVTAYEAAIKLASNVGSEADELKASSEKQLENAYYRNGITLYKSKKYDASVAQFTMSKELAKKSGDTEMEDKLTVITAKVLSSKGMSQIKSKDLNGAMASFDEAHAVKPTCVISYYGKGIVWKEKGDLGQMMVSMDKAIELGATEPKMDKYVAKAKTAASKALVSEATVELTREHGKIAADYINDSFKYKSGNADTYYYLTIAYNKSKNFANAAKAANTALGMKEGDKSDIYFELGQALQGSGDTGGACDAYKKVGSGPNVDAAKYQMTQVLSCG